MLLNKFKDLKHAKILLIDIIGSVFNTENEIYSYNKYHNIYVLTILSEKLKHLLNTTFSSDFSQYYNLDQQLANDTLNLKITSKSINTNSNAIKEENLNDAHNGTTQIENDKTTNRPQQIKQQKPANERIYEFNVTTLMNINGNFCNLMSFIETELNQQQSNNNNIYVNQSYCETRLKTYCVMKKVQSAIAWKMKIKQLCNVLTNIRSDNNYYTGKTVKNSFTSYENLDVVGKKSNLNPSTNHIIFSEYFNLFNYIVNVVTDTMQNNTTTSTNTTQVFQLDFVILDFKSFINQLNESIIMWRPSLILQQNQFKNDQFELHEIISNFIGDPIHQTWKCGVWCWIIIAVIIFILILIIFFSILIGVAAR